jgi:hypothetical protein
MPAARQVVLAVRAEMVVLIAAVETAAAVAKHFSVISFLDADQIVEAGRLKS